MLAENKGFSFLTLTSSANQYQGNPAPRTRENPLIECGAKGAIGVVLNHQFSLYFESQPIWCYDWSAHIKCAPLKSRTSFSLRGFPAVTKTLSDAAPFQSGCRVSSLCLLALSCQNKKSLKNTRWEFEKKLNIVKGP